MALANVAQKCRLKLVETQVEQVAEEIDHIKQGTIPAGYQGYSYLQAIYGLSNAKSKQLVMARPAARSRRCPSFTKIVSFLH